MNLDINFYIGQRLLGRRRELGVSQEKIGRGIGIASQQVQKYEKGTNSMNARRLYEFATLLHVPVSYFFDGFEEGAANGMAEEKTAFMHQNEELGASDREKQEVIKSFEQIRDKALRKKIADLLRTLSTKDV